ncbi:MAG: hypothetical protein HDQ88_03305 [Clostridia bacterium]|nr:hypothetical protein [Clostridia bacterium]
MEIHFFEKDTDMTQSVIPCHGWYETLNAIEKRTPCIATTQMGLLSTRLIEDGYRVFVHPADERPYEIRLDDKNTCTDKELRMTHNLFRMWQAGAFHANATEHH